MDRSIADDETELFELREADLPAPYEPEWSDLKTKDQFGKAAFELLKEASMLVVLLVHRVPPTPYQRDEAIRRGLVKRLALLGKSLLANIANDSGYQQLQIVRQIVEAASNYVYLTTDDGSGERYNAYVNESLAEEKHNLEVIAAQIRARGGDSLPIERRMRRSIERMATAAGTSFEAVPAKKDSGWPNSFERLKALSPTAYPAYRAGSSALHAGWSSLLLRDLDEVAGGFSLDKQDEPAIQPITAAGTVLSETALHYLDVEGDDVEKAWFSTRLIAVREKILHLDKAHEQFLQSA